MNNQIAIGLLLLIAAFLFYDATYQDWEGSLFLAKKGDQFIEYLAIWR